MSIELTRCPEDSVSALRFSPAANEPNMLLVSSWDSKLRLYDVDMDLVRSLQTLTAPLLDCCFVNAADKCVSGGLAKEIRLHDFNKEMDVLIGKHAEPVRNVRYNPRFNLLFSGSWDKTVAVWDIRSQNICHRLNIGAKIFALSVTDQHSQNYDKLVVCDSEKKISIYDLRKLDQPEEVRESVAKYQIRCVQTFGDGNGFAVGTTEGRVAYEYFNPDKNLASIGPSGQPPAPPLPGYSFKCHRTKMQFEDIAQCSAQGFQVTGDTDKVYPVNCIAFNQLYNTFATGGGDGTVSVWDGLKKKRLWRLSKPLATSVTSLGFNADSSRLAIAVSYDNTQKHNVEPRLLKYAQIIIKELSAEDIRRN